MLRVFLCTFVDMGRIMAIDFGRKRCGIAVTDPLRIVANGLCTVATAQLNEYVTRYIASETVDEIVVGLPVTMQGNPSESQRWLIPAIDRLKKRLPPELPVKFFDERFTSAIAHRAMIDGGMPKMQRRDKETVDRMAATIILNDYLQSKTYNDNK